MPKRHRETVCCSEYEISHITKREMKILSVAYYFFPAHLMKSCEVCQRLYGVNKDACFKEKFPPDNPCLPKAKLDRKRFESELNGSGSKAPTATNKAAEKAPK